MSFRSWWSDTVRFKEAIESWVYWHRPEILAFRRVRLLDGAFGTSLWYIGKSWLKKSCDKYGYCAVSLDHHIDAHVQALDSRVRKSDETTFCSSGLTVSRVLTCMGNSLIMILSSCFCYFIHFTFSFTSFSLTKLDTLKYSLLVCLHT